MKYKTNKLPQHTHFDVAYVLAKTVTLRTALALYNLIQILSQLFTQTRR